jgi:hypothetical protein
LPKQCIMFSSTKNSPHAKDYENMLPQLSFAKIGKSKIHASFDTPEMTSDFGTQLLREVDSRTKIISTLANCIQDWRHPSYVTHSLEDLLRQRVFQICQGYEDADDCDHLRNDASFKTALGISPSTDRQLCSQPTMTRLENGVTLRDLIRLFYGQIDIFLESYSSAPKFIVIDVDPSSSHCHGSQQMSMFNKYEDEYCLMPFHVYEGNTGREIATVIRPGKTPTAGEIIALLKRIVKKVKARFPKTMLVFRADGHHSKPKVHEWCKDHGVEYVIGQPGNPVLDRLFQVTIDDAKKRFKKTQRAVRLYASSFYKAGSWKEHRKVICRILVDAQGRVDTRYIVTTFEQTQAKYLYDTIYCGRANAELFIKDHKRALMSDRTSCHRASANQFRLAVHSAAYSLMHALRENLLKGTSLATATFDTIRVRLLKVAAHVSVMKTKIHFHLPEYFPLKEVYYLIMERLMVIQT